jgi:hypothetical protein
MSDKAGHFYKMAEQLGSSAMDSLFLSASKVLMQFTMKT